MLITQNTSSIHVYFLLQTIPVTSSGVPVSDRPFTRTSLLGFVGPVSSTSSLCSLLTFLTDIKWLVCLKEQQDIWHKTLILSLIVHIYLQWKVICWSVYSENTKRREILFHITDLRWSLISLYHKGPVITWFLFLSWKQRHNSSSV